MNLFLQFILARLCEPSSWAGIATIAATAANAVHTQDPALMGAAVAGAVAILTPERKAPAS